MHRIQSPPRRDPSPAHLLRMRSVSATSVTGAGSAAGRWLAGPMSAHERPEDLRASVTERGEAVERARALAGHACRSRRAAARPRSPDGRHFTQGPEFRVPGDQRAPEDHRRGGNQLGAGIAGKAVDRRNEHVSRALDGALRLGAEQTRSAQAPVPCVGVEDGCASSPQSSWKGATRSPWSMKLPVRLLGSAPTGGRTRATGRLRLVTTIPRPVAATSSTSARQRALNWPCWDADGLPAHGHEFMVASAATRGSRQELPIPLMRHRV